jgi:hypothetical protein
MSSRYLAGLDLGQAADYTALIIAEQVRDEDAPTRYDVRHIQRYRLHTPYPEIVAAVAATLGRPELARQFQLIVDGTGVGRAVVDLFRAEHTLQGLMVPISITAGAVVTLQDDGWVNVPKKDLVATTPVLLQQQRLRFARGLPETALLTSELQTFQVRMTASANETFAAREGQHDDLVLALALLCWYGENMPPPRPGLSPEVLRGRAVKGWGYGDRSRTDDTRRGIVTRHESALGALAEMASKARGQ